MKRIVFCLAASLFVFSCACNEGSNTKITDPVTDPSTDPEEPVVTEVEPEGFRIVAVDLGLSVKWANANIGANAPEEFGEFFAWGETESKSKYDWASYKWAKGDPGSITKYNTESDYGKVDKLTVLKSDDDVAAKTLGDNWRMPTMKEWSELLNKCKWERTEVNGVKGFMVSGNNGNSIFIPAAGSWDKGRHSHVGEDGFYWASSLLEEDPNAAWSMHFGTYGSAETYMYHYRNYGQSVRAVCK